MDNNIITKPIIFTSARLEAIGDKFVFLPMGTSLAAIRILRLLEQEGELMPKRIMELSGGTKSNVSQRLKHLEEKKYIQRTYAAFAEDKRKVVVKITREGKTQLQKVDKRLSKAQMKLKGYFSQKEIENHLNFFAKMNKLIDNEEKNLEKVFN